MIDNFEVLKNFKKRLMGDQQDLDPKIQKIILDHFWGLIENSDKENVSSKK